MSYDYQQDPSQQSQWTPDQQYDQYGNPIQGQQGQAQDPSQQGQWGQQQGQGQMGQAQQGQQVDQYGNPIQAQPGQWGQQGQLQDPSQQGQWGQQQGQMGQAQQGQWGQQQGQMGQQYDQYGNPIQSQQGQMQDPSQQGQWGQQGQMGQAQQGQDPMGGLRQDAQQQIDQAIDQYGNKIPGGQQFTPQAKQEASNILGDLEKEGEQRMGGMFGGGQGSQQ